MGNPEEQAVRLAQKLKYLLDIVEEQDGLVAGTVYMASTRCGHKACKCMNSEYRHQSRCVSFKEGPRSFTRTVPEVLTEGIMARTGGYRQVRVLRREIARDAALLLKGVDEIIAKAVHEGQRGMLSAITKARSVSK